MINDYINNNLKKARYKILTDGTYYADIPHFRGVWASARRLEDCRQELAEVLEGWVLLKIRKGNRIPGFNVSIRKLACKSVFLV